MVWGKGDGVSWQVHDLLAHEPEWDDLVAEVGRGLIVRRSGEVVQEGSLRIGSGGNLLGEGESTESVERLNEELSSRSKEDQDESIKIKCESYDNISSVSGEDKNYYDDGDGLISLKELRTANTPNFDNYNYDIVVKDENSEKIRLKIEDQSISDFTFKPSSLYSNRSYRPIRPIPPSDIETFPSRSNSQLKTLQNVTVNLNIIRTLQEYTRSQQPPRPSPTPYPRPSSHSKPSQTPKTKSSPHPKPSLTPNSKPSPSSRRVARKQATPQRELRLFDLKREDDSHTTDHDMLMLEDMINLKIENKKQN